MISTERIERVIDRAFEPSVKYVCAMEREILRIMEEENDLLLGKFELDGDISKYKRCLESYKVAGNNFSRDYQEAAAQEQIRIQQQIGLSMLYIKYHTVGPLRRVDALHLPVRILVY